MLAQGGKNKEKNREEIEALHVEYMTTALDLTLDESKIFWPIYNDYKQKKSTLGNSNDIDEYNISSLSEEESKAKVDQFMSYDQNKLALKQELYERLLNEFSSKRLLTFIQTEHSFKRRMWNKLKRRKQ